MIADVYATAIDDDAWPGMSALLGKASGIEAVTVWVTEGSTIVDYSIASAFRAVVGPYKERFAQIDPWAASLARNRPETVMIGPEHMGEDELVRTEFYNEFARPFGMFRPMGVRMRLAPGVHAIVGSDQPSARTLFERTDKPRLELLVPHIKRALQLRRRIRDGRLNGSAPAAALDAYSFGAVICDLAGRVVLANEAAEAMAREGAGIVLSRRGGSIGALVSREAQVLCALIRDAAGGGAGGVLRLTGAAGAPELLVLVTPLPGRREGDNVSGRALVTLRSVHDRPAFSAALLESLFRLSPTQASVALAIFAGKSPEQIAVERGVKVSTLRTHLAEIFFRTGTANQRELVRLLGNLPPLRRYRP